MSATDEHRALAARDASLGVRHIWTATACPAYRSLDPADCVCEQSDLDRAILRHRRDPSPANRAELDRLSRAHLDAFYLSESEGFIRRTT